MTKRYKPSELIGLPIGELIDMYAESRKAFASAYIHARQGPSPTGTGHPTADDALHGAEQTLHANGIHFPETILLALASRGIRP